MAKACIFKLAAVLERINLFTRGQVRARTATLFPIEAELNDSMQFKPGQNPFKERPSKN